MNATKKKNINDIPLADKLAMLKAYLDSQGAADIEIILLKDAFTDALVVAGATSRRHAQGLAEGIGRLCAEKGMEFLGMEGFENAQWILVDCNDVIINIFQEDARNLYKIEELWARAAKLAEQEK